MAESSEKRFLRIYCVCGQKMKVTESSFGRPGKCVACKQKIRIPNLDEVPEGETDIYLKDHPEFLRKVKRPATSSASIAEPKVKSSNKVVYREREHNHYELAPAEDEELALGEEEAEPIEMVALDVLEPLRNVCSLEFKIQRQLELLSEDPEQENIRAEAEGHLARIHTVRAELDEQLRQRLMEVAIELATAQDKLAQARLSARLGEVGFEEYQSSTYRLRSRRDRLERRQQNLRGWVATTEPHLAGGFLDLSMDSLPEDGFTVSIPSEPKTSAPLVDVHTSALRDAFTLRTNTERKLSELKRLKEEGTENKNVLGNEELEANRDLLLANVRIAFSHERLAQLRKDYTSDLETIVAQLDVVRGRMQSGDLPRAGFDQAERFLLKAKTDLNKALSVVDRALSANSQQDVPKARGTFLDRMGFHEREDSGSGGREDWFAFGSAALLVLLIFLPLVGSTSLLGSFVKFFGTGGWGHWSIVIPILVAGSVVAATRIPAVRVRFAFLLGTFVFGSLLATDLIHHTVYGIDPMSARFRTGPALFFRPGTLALIVAGAGIFFSAFLTAVRADISKRISVAVGISTVVLCALIMTDFLGYFVPRPDVRVKTTRTQGAERAEISVANTGHRDFYVVKYPSDARSAYQFFVERKLGGSSWTDAGVDYTQVSQSGLPDGVLYRISPGEIITLNAPLDAGTYRALLHSKALDRKVQAEFSIREELSDGSSPPPSARTTDTRSPSDESEALTLMEDDTRTVELHGIGIDAKGKSRFSFTVYRPDETERRMALVIDQELYGGWKITRYNPDTGIVLLSNEVESMRLRKGERVPLMPRGNGDSF